MFGIGARKMEMKIPITSFTSAEEIEGTLFFNGQQNCKS
jgi:hypothetical protein